MATFVLAHAHAEDECRVAYAAWRGFSSPLRGHEAMASCVAGDHRIFWTVEAQDAETARAQLPTFLAERTHVSRVTDVAIR